MFGGYALTFGRGRHRHALRASAQDHGLAIVDRSHFLLVAEQGVPILETGNVVLVGQLFGCDGLRARTLPPGIGDRAGPLPTKRLLEAHWGSFSLFGSSPEAPWAYREPSGSVAAYRLGDGANAIFASDAMFADRLGLLSDPEIDPRFAVHWLQFPFLRTRRTGVSGVTELLPGMLCELRPGRRWTERLWWNPAEFARRDVRIRDPAEAARLVRDTALSAVPAQAREEALLELSGGLDSSIVAACLARAGVSATCVNFATQSAEGDERDYARKVAAACSFALREIRETGFADLAVGTWPRFHPATNPLLAPLERAIEEIKGEIKAPLVIDGAGGDNLFYALATVAPVIDALLGDGLRQARQAAHDIAERANATWWHVVLLAARRLARRRRPWKEDRSFLRREALLKGPEVHPWLSGCRGLPPGKREHIEALVHITHFLDRGGSASLKLHPLLAQPLLEACLRVPTWLWMAGGRDRAVARDAFAGILPGAILERRTKGSLQGMFHRSFVFAKPRLRELLLSGELQSRGIIDRSKVDFALESEDCAAEVQLRVTELAALELWLQSWTARPTGPSTRP